MKKQPKAIEFGPRRDEKATHGYRNVRFIENASRGLRLVGFADEVAETEGDHRSIDHKGWYIDEEDFNSVYRGIVYQLPSRDKTPQYVYGYADPNNDDCALLCFETTEHKLQAAEYADRFAEIFAEQTRDYQVAWQASQRCEELSKEIKDARGEALAIASEMRAAKRTNLVAPTICASLRATILSLYRGIQKMRKERADLLSSYGRCEGWVE